MEQISLCATPTEPKCSGAFVPQLENLSVSSAAQSCPSLCDHMDRSTPGFPVHHRLPELAQTLVQGVGDVIQPSHLLLSPSPPWNSPGQNTFPSPGDFLHPRISPGSPALQEDSVPSEPPGKSIPSPNHPPTTSILFNSPRWPFEKASWLISLAYLKSTIPVIIRIKSFPYFPFHGSSLMHTSLAMILKFM